MSTITSLHVLTLPITMPTTLLLPLHKTMWSPPYLATTTDHLALPLGLGASPLFTATMLGGLHNPSFVPTITRR